MTSPNDYQHNHGNHANDTFDFVLPSGTCFYVNGEPIANVEEGKISSWNMSWYRFPDLNKFLDWHDVTLDDAYDPAGHAVEITLPSDKGTKVSLGKFVQDRRQENEKFLAREKLLQPFSSAARFQLERAKINPHVAIECTTGEKVTTHQDITVRRLNADQIRALDPDKNSREPYRSMRVAVGADGKILWVGYDVANDGMGAERIAQRAYRLSLN